MILFCKNFALFKPFFSSGAIEILVVRSFSWPTCWLLRCSMWCVFRCSWRRLRLERWTPWRRPPFRRSFKSRSTHCENWTTRCVGWKTSNACWRFNATFSGLQFWTWTPKYTFLRYSLKVLCCVFSLINDTFFLRCSVFEKSARQTALRAADCQSTAADCTGGAANGAWQRQTGGDVRLSLRRPAPPQPTQKGPRKEGLFVCLSVYSTF